MNRLAIAAAIALALSASPAFGWDDKECEDWLKTHPTPHPDCVQATPTPKPPRHEKTPTPTTPPTVQPTSTSTVPPQPTATAATPSSPTATPTTAPPTPTNTVVPTQATPQTECIPCGEADAPTPMPPLGPAGPNSPAVLAAVVEIAPAVAPQAMPVQVLAAGPALLPFTGDAIPYVASILLGLGMTVGGWLIRRGS